MRQLLTITAILFLWQTSFAHNPFWVHIDKNLIKKTVELDRNEPHQVEAFFIGNKCDLKKETLGFGWTMWTPRIGGGYICISAIFYYYNDTIVSYTLVPELPDEKGLVKKYKKWYQNSFENPSGNIQPFKFNEEETLKPLIEYKGYLLTDSVSNRTLAYMSPESGIMYGYAGGYSGGILSNRQAFMELKDSATKEEIILIMYSINPASRLTAIEYYLRYNHKFGDNEDIDKWVEMNFLELPTVKTLSGCLVQSEYTRNLVHMYSSREEEE